jgi:hypothetical protein
MAVLQDDIGNGIKTLLADGSYSAIGSRAGYGLTWSHMGDLGKYGRGLVRPLGKARVDGRNFDSSSQFEMLFDVVLQDFDRAAPHEKLTALIDQLGKDFSDAGDALYGATAVTNADLLGGALAIDVDAPEITTAGELFDETENPDSILIRVPVRVRVWQSH